MRSFVMYWRYTYIINLVIGFWKPVNFIASKLCVHVLAIKLRIYFVFSLVLIFFGQKKLFLRTSFTTFQWTDNISMNFSEHTIHNSTSMWNAIFLLCLFLIKIQSLYVLMVIILCCNCNQTFAGILKWNVKMFRYNHGSEIICHELPAVNYKNSNWEQFQSN